MTAPSLPPLRFTGSENLAHRLVLSTLTGRAIRVSQIRPSSHAHPGLAAHEISLIRLLDSITNGSAVEFSYTGTTFIYRPGLIVGSASGYGASGGILRHELPADCTRGVSYFLIPLCLLAPFSISPVNVLFTGPGVITSATPAGDVSVDSVRTAILPIYGQFGITHDLELRIIRRSSPAGNGRGGAGEVQLVFGHQVRLPKTLHLLNPGRVKRVRGVAYSTGVAGANNARMIESARGILNPFVSDTYIFSDISSAPYLLQSSNSKFGNPDHPQKRKTGIGFGLSLLAETTTNCLYSADVASPPSGGVPAEDVGLQCAYELLESISKGGCITSVAAPTALILMATGSEDVGRLQVGKSILATKEIITLARDLAAFGASGWGLKESKTEEESVVVSVVGKGVGNVGRKIT